MIKNIKMKRCATYSNQGIRIEDCKKINFIYGANGSGKSTIGKFLHDQTSEDYSCCEVESDSNSEIDIIVYNRDFKNRNIVEIIDGVFTLGEATDKEIQKLKDLKAESEELEDDLKSKNKALDIKREELAALNTSFSESVWEEIFKKNDQDFKEAFAGYRNSKEKFLELVIRKYNVFKTLSNKGTICKKDDLLDRSRTLFSSQLKTCEEIQIPLEENIGLAREVELNNIWNEVIVGNTDLPISELINYLQNADWVNKGREYLENDGVCPFCQKETITANFVDQLNAFFSGEYEAKVENIKSLKQKYQDIKKVIKLIKEEIIENEQRVETGKINKDALTTILTTLGTSLERNSILMSNKEKEPGSKVELTQTTTLLSEIGRMIEEGNSNITSNNELLKNKDEEKKNLIDDVWMFLMNHYSDLIKEHLKKISDCEKGIKGLNQRCITCSDDLKSIKQEIIKAGRNITSVQPTVDEINRLLDAYGFTNFKIVPSKEHVNSYQIQREDGTLASHTLSEGEETFISFLYFLQFAKGSVERDKVSSKKIMVLDDPISSLDSTILYIVSSMVKSLISDIRKGESDVVQLFVLTHNVFFHKEASYIDGRNDEFKDVNYWIISKNDGVTDIRSFGMKNPIKTSYELLWQELRDHTNISLVTAQNTMRRILENYFGILGKRYDDRIEKSFETVEEQMICRSLISWINDGSHSIPDDLYIDSYTDSVSRYKSVFKNIFINMGHEAHYNMMMKIEENDDVPN